MNRQISNRTLVYAKHVGSATVRCAFKTGIIMSAMLLTNVSPGLHKRVLPPWPFSVTCSLGRGDAFLHYTEGTSEACDFCMFSDDVLLMVREQALGFEPGWNAHALYFIAYPSRVHVNCFNITSSTWSFTSQVQRPVRPPCLSHTSECKFPC